MAALYQQVPVTLTPFTPIPDEALPSAGLDEEDAALVKEASEEYAADTAVSLSATASGLDAEFTLDPATELEEGFQVQWSFGNGRDELGDDLVQRARYSQPGTYTVTAVVIQPGESSFAVDTIVVIGEDEPAA